MKKTKARRITNISIYDLEERNKSLSGQRPRDMLN